MTNTPTQSIAKSKTITRGYIGLCLKFVRECYDIKARDISASVAWENAKKKHVTTNVGGIPVGAPVFFKIPSNKYGHVAIYLGAGKFRTNYSAKGTVVTASLSDNVFNTMKMLGWSEDINGVTIKFDKVSNPTVVLNTPAKITAWQKSMNKVFPTYSNFKVDGKYGPYSMDVTREFQKRVGLRVDGILGQLTAREMRKFGVSV